MKFLFLAVGKPKHRFYQEGFQHYLTQISHFTEVECLEVKDHSTQPEKEVELLQDVLTRKKLLEGLNRIYLLDDAGKAHTSEAFAQLVGSLKDQGIQRLVFVVGGAYGFPETWKKQYPRISLSNLLFPHDLARLVLAEQVYRALHILRGGKYHHEE